MKRQATMNDTDLHLAERVTKLERQLRIAVVAAIVGVGTGAAAMAGGFSSQATAAAPKSVIDHLRVRQLDIVDAKGTTRVKLAAPLPAPIINGETKTRGGDARNTMSGLLLFDADGIERSGYATVDRGYANVLLTLDSPNEQHAMFIAEPNGATTLRLFNRDSNDRVDVAIDKRGPSISMIRHGKQIYRQPAE
tara:strand:- start:661 stop:1239 length:579 start_codon:yes stop_codon:yes gene_type:complete